jgi:hypothetical protein
MAVMVCARLAWERQAAGPLLPGFRQVVLEPCPGSPFGAKGAAMAGAWRQLGHGDADGMLVQDGDVAADPLDLAAMRAAIAADPLAVWAAAVRLWPGTTGEASWAWSNWGPDGPAQALDPPGGIRRFTTCFTWLPRALISRSGLQRQEFPLVDRWLSSEARRLGLDIRRPERCLPKHLHW